MKSGKERFELKYLVDEGTRRRLVQVLGLRLVPDPEGDAEGRFGVVSLYLDTPGLDGYQHPVRGRQARRKVRLRRYERGTASAQAFVEVKHRIGRRSATHRARLPLEAAIEALGGTDVACTSPVDRGLLEETRALVAERGLRPSCVVRFTRQAFLGTDGEQDLRVTIDSDVSARFEDLALEPAGSLHDEAILPEGMHLLEIEVERAVPSWLTLLMGRLDGIRQCPSKYAMALERHRARARRA